MTIAAAVLVLAILCQILRAWELRSMTSHEVQKVSTVEALERQKPGLEEWACLRAVRGLVGRQDHFRSSILTLVSTVNGLLSVPG